MLARTLSSTSLVTEKFCNLLSNTFSTKEKQQLGTKLVAVHFDWLSRSGRKASVEKECILRIGYTERIPGNSSSALNKMKEKTKESILCERKMPAVAAVVVEEFKQLQEKQEL